MTVAAPRRRPPALELRDLEVAYRVRGIWRPVLRGSFTIADGESYGLVGESGCGKSTAAYAVLRYLPRNGRISSGLVEVAGEDLADMSEARGARAARLQGLDGLPEPRRGAEPDDPGRRPGGRGLHAGRHRGRARERAEEMLARSRSPTPTASCGATRTSSRAACSSAS